MQEIQTGDIMILQQRKEFNLKLPQLFTGLQQSIDEPTHIRKNSSSCIDLIFTNPPNLIIKIVNTKLSLLRPGLELNILYLTNAMSGIMQKLMFME